MKLVIKKNTERRQKQQFVTVLADLLANGFPLRDAVSVMERSQRFAGSLVVDFQRALFLGKPLAECFQQIGFSPQEVAQIELAELHGDISQTLAQIARQLRLMGKQKRELEKVLTYPALLLFFVVVVLISLQQILLPQLLASGMIAKNHWGILFLTWVPYLLGGLVLLGIITVLLFRHWLKAKTALQRACFFAGLPLIGRFYLWSLSAYFSLEWGKLFAEGIELKQIIHFMLQTHPASLMYELAQDLNQSLLQGEVLSEKFKQYPFFPPEFSLIIFQGETKGKLGEELLLYSELTSQLLFRKIEILLQWIQPIVFLLIAFLVVSVYGAMFLPIYGNMGEMTK